ncbi:LysR family transcriptional regulator [Marinomonas transparens]|uniref:LysR family transcriptional regulator n=1 Tax=Marinomonas transparens TaxID=2795388 RepID=A0A934JU90_9GAMM|nr:LysR family transcriptional regulator [Marinomonas transparens]MBJ7538431.1 LysR family transcriptional regulator [Marinomonas transparens]
MTHPDFQISWLRTFIAVVDTGSLSAAAPLIYRSQSAVSMHIKKLENLVGSELLSRGPHHLEVTPKGLELLTYARRILDLQNEAHDALFKKQLSGLIRIGVPDDYALYLSPILRHFSSRHTGVEIELTCEQSTSLIPRIHNNELDIALVSQDKKGQGQLLFQEPLLWVGAEKYEIWRKKPLPIAVYEAGSMAQIETISALKQCHKSYRIVYKSSGLSGQLAAVESGLAIAALTRCSIPSELKILQNLPTEYSLPELQSMKVAVLRSKRSQKSTVVDVMHQQIVQTLQTELE